MADRGIIFSAPMVLALLDGRKMQTRRLATSPLRQCKVGDRLWVREAWRTSLAYEDLKPSVMGGEEPVFFEADGTTERWTRGTAEIGRLRPGMHMPRWASRLTLIVEAVRVEPLQAIREADALAEGIGRIQFPDRGDWGWPQRRYRDLWTSLHGPDSWTANPQVVALTFRVEKRNIDEVPHA